jgi:hypothetical protein
LGGIASVALLVSALASGCGDSDSGITGSGGGGGVAGSGGMAAGAFATAGEPPGGTGGAGAGSGGAAGETAAMGGAAGGPTPSNEAGAGGEAPDCGPLRAGPHCEFKKFQSLYPNTNFSFEEVVSLSRDGRYVATRSTNLSGPTEAHRVSVFDSTKDVLMPPQASSCTPTAISEDGSWVAGVCLEGSTQRPFYWTKSSGAIYYDPALGIEEVHGRSADAQVLFGSRQLTADGTAGAGGGENAPSGELVFRWGADGSFLSGSAGPPRWTGWAASVLPNRDGSRVIIDAPVPGEYSTPMVFRWSSPATLQPMTVRDNYYYDDYFATDVARVRDVTIGVTETCDAHGCGYFPVIWDQTLVADYIEGDWPGGFAAACNRDCSVIAGDVTREVGPDFESGPGLWTHLSPPNADHVVKAETHFLVELLGASTALDGWSLGTIVAMSDDGKVIAGNGQLNGKPMGWVIHL